MIRIYVVGKWAPRVYVAQYSFELYSNPMRPYVFSTGGRALMQEQTALNVLFIIIIFWVSFSKKTVNTSVV